MRVISLKSVSTRGTLKCNYLFLKILDFAVVSQDGLEFHGPFHCILGPCFVYLGMHLYSAVFMAI